MGRFAVVLVLACTWNLQGQENESLLTRHVPSEFARTKFSVISQEGLPVLYKGDRELSTRELFVTIGQPQRFDEYNELAYSAQKYRTRSRWLHSIARFSAFGSLFFGASRLDDESVTLHEWLPTIEMATFGAYAWFMARRYDYRAALIQKNQQAILDELNLEQWVTEYNLQLYQKLIDSGLTFSE